LLLATSSTRDMGRQRPTCFGRRQRLGASPGSLTIRLRSPKASRKADATP